MSDVTPEVPTDDSMDSAGSGLAAEKSRRLALLDEMRSSGTDPYPYRFDRTHTLSQVRLDWGELEPGVETEDPVSIAGRIMLKRDSGKLIFATIRDRSGDLQLFISKAVVGDDEFDAVKHLDLGDWVGVAGTVMTTRKGELSVKPDTVQLLSKAIRPLPDKWHGLTDVDTRFRQRYADLIVNEDARRNFEIRHETVASFRRTLGSHGFIEVETPVLHPEVGGAHARPFTTHHNALDMPLYLRIAVELYLKRLIVGGMERVYEIARTFRNEGVSTRHNPEFTMMESYQAFADWNDVMDLTEELITTAARDALGTTVVEIRGEQIDLADPWPRKRMVDYASDGTGVELHPSMPIDDIRKVAADHDVFVESFWGAGKIIEELFEATSEASIVRPTFVTGHPVEISPLARVDRDDPHLTERFELFVDGRELANGYSELNDPVEQRARFEEEQAAKDAGDAEAGSVDEDYIRALEYGMPPTGGLGIGIDRLAMLLAGVDSIKEVILFPTLRPEGGLSGSS
ncbi:MAG: lysine--tRNA ligase [Ilumatobacter sp.]|uniref:lysine--tRNA ligase n=1 Tax=Ilumatobacter sp. TaxID=1967498 RepID=UPI003C77F3F5